MTPVLDRSRWHPSNNLWRPYSITIQWPTMPGTRAHDKWGHWCYLREVNGVCQANDRGHRCYQHKSPWHAKWKASTEPCS